MRYFYLLLLINSYLFIGSTFSQNNVSINAESYGVEMKYSLPQMNLTGIKSVINPNPLMLNYDVKFYKLNIEAYDTTNQFVADATVAAKVLLHPLDTFSIELSNKLAIDSAFIDDALYPVTHTGNNLYIELPVPVPVGKLFTFQLYYHTPPAYVSSYYSTTQNPTYGNFHVSQTLSEPYFAHEWMPCKQDLQDKADSVFIFVTTDSSLRAAGPGLLTIVDLPEGKKRYEWRTHIPTDYYLIFFAVSDYLDYRVYAKPDSLPGDSVLIQTFVYDYPGCLASNKAAIDATPAMIELLSNLYYPFPFHEEKYGHYMWYPSGFSGMEHITMSGMRYLNTYLISHELGHSWFGDNVTCATWSDIWLNEGFATYTEYLVLQYLYSQASADAKMTTYMNNVMSLPGGSVYVPENELNSVGRIFNTRLSYYKGGALVHMIRFEMNNDSLFFKTLYEYQKQYSGGVATGLDFKAVCESVSGIDFTDFFNQWYFGEGFPIYSIYWSQDQDTITLHNIQQTSTTITPLFKTPMEYKLSWIGGDTTIRVYQTNNDTTYHFNISNEITSVVVDPNNWLLNQVGENVHLKNLRLKVYLEGAYNPLTGYMKTDLNPGLIPLAQPFNQPPWNYDGAETANQIPVDAVDWVLIELRDTTQASFATGETRIDRKAGFLLKDGSVTSADGLSSIEFTNSINNQLFVVIHHRNHLSIINSNPLVYNKGVYTYDFSNNAGQVLGGINGYKELESGVWGMAAGDADASGVINAADKSSAWESKAGKSGYLNADLNLNRQADNLDKDDYWLPNNGKTSQVPQ